MEKEAEANRIDKHHRRFIYLIEQLKMIPINSGNKQELMSFLYKLSYYAENSFQDEEIILNRHKCPNYANHRAEHKKFIQNMNQIQQLFIENSESILPDLLLLLDDWYENHILRLDNQEKHFYETA